MAEETMMMAYQGEDICFTIRGDSSVDLESSDFTFLAYPCDDPSSPYSVAKAECEKTAENEYVATIPQSYSMTMRTGYYTIEIYDGTNRAIYQKRNAFVVNVSGAKTLIQQ